MAVGARQTPRAPFSLPVRPTLEYFRSVISTSGMYLPKASEELLHDQRKLTILGRTISICFTLTPENVCRHLLLHGPIDPSTWPVRRCSSSLPICALAFSYEEIRRSVYPGGVCLQCSACALILLGLPALVADISSRRHTERQYIDKVSPIVFLCPPRPWSANRPRSCGERQLKGCWASRTPKGRQRV